ncbi:MULTISPECIES: HAD family phosphatase [unclassified Ruegeria]|uniref:HAD family hydrolase n=1 Tax=unclassified Ruegeria TaxID=2625375 RepID=UPI001488CF88|nr:MULTISPECIES: HAD family phosphatase [unclassified Ruegeria]NOD48805.1 HAD-IA family hydrolase [Ruegeria sp. HKCCD5849]NOD51892.1 HAD-IA family hydrolase [Ruegeria sp. HKCCD5851]NOD66550.1 HAD-IA family hydrolase [Ruegeria sp. HKCCD7303]NOE33963.1 HAD-IA family hydrolase [Ruegeria sp. HKCCD7318]
MHDLVIFDCDGVLVDSEVISNQVLVENLAGYDLHLTLPECMSLFVGGTMVGVRDKARSMGADLPDDWVDQIYAETYDRLRKGVPLVPGVSELLVALDQNGIPFCVASNGSPDKMKITLGQNGLWDRFKDVMFSAHVLGTGKPDPRMFKLAAQHFEANAPVVIEDSENGVTAATRAGMRCLAYAPHGGRLADLGAEVITHMSQAHQLLGL